MASANRLIEAIDESYNSYNDAPDDHDALINISRRDAKDALDYIAQLQIRCSQLATALFDAHPDHPMLRVDE